MADLKTNYKDDVLDTSKNEKRKFRMIQNDDGTVSFDDATEYTQQGDTFGAADINATNAKINEQNQSLTNLPRFEKINFTISNSSETVIDYPDGFNKDNTSVLSLIIKTSDVTYNQIPIFNQNATYSGNSFMNQSVFYKNDGIHFYNAQSTYRGMSAVVNVMRF